MPCFLCVEVNVGASAPNPNQRTFCKKSFGISKTFAKIKWCVCAKVLRIFKGLFQKPLEARSPHAVPTYNDKLKNADFSAFFVSIISRGYPPQTRTQETFREKFLGTSKAFTKVNGVFGAKFFGLPFFGER